MSALNKTKSWRNISEKKDFFEWRRTFLEILWVWALALSSKTSKAVRSILDFEPNTNSDQFTEPKFEFPEAETLSESFRHVWEREVRFFMWQFGLDETTFSSKVKEIQAEAWLEQDWVIWPETLKHIYREYYSQNIDSFPLEVQARARLDKNLSNYKNPRNYKISWLKWAFHKWYFFWQWVWENADGTFFSSELLNHFWEEIMTSESGNVLKIDKLSYGKYYLALYVDGELRVLTYVSPWTPGNPTPQSRTYNIQSLDKYHISSSYPERTWGWAVMPFAYQISWSIYWHIWLVNWWWESHWCIRAPGFYQQEIYEIIKENWYENFKVKIWRLY